VRKDFGLRKPSDDGGLLLLWLTFVKRASNAPVQRRGAQRTVRCNRLLARSFA